jgi:hypothetical protein
VRRRQHGEGRVDADAENRDVGHRAGARALAQRYPREQDERADAGDDPAEPQAGALRQALVEHVPRVQSEPRLHQQRHAHAVQDQADAELRGAAEVANRGHECHSEGQLMRDQEPICEVWP